MNFKGFNKSFKSLKTENGYWRIVGLVMAVCILAMIIDNITRDEKIILQPVTLSEDAWVTKNNASHSYKKSWGLFMAVMFGNVTPANAPFIKEHISPLISPVIYDDVMAQLEHQVEAIREDSITMRFEPKYVEYEKESDKVFVYGFSFVKGQVSKEVRSERTYEYQVTINNYAPTFSYLDTYPTKPRTQEFIEIENQRNQAK